MSANPESSAETGPSPASPMRLPRVDQHLSVLPEAAPAETAQPEDAPQMEDMRNPLFELLVQNESDVTGLLAYALYKQNKRDWLIAFQATHGRGPDAAETKSFILGERLPRRTATYRRLAEDMQRRSEDTGPGLLSGLMQAPANDSRAVGPTLQQAAKSPITWRYIAIMLMMLVAMAIVFKLAAGWLFGTPGR